MSDAAPDGPSAVKDEHTAHPIAGQWRPLLREVVERFARGDYGIQDGIAGVDPISPETAEHIRMSIEAYGATLIPLPEDTWLSSISQWYGAHWKVLVDLWTAEEGRSDLVLDGRITESGRGPRLTINIVYVP